MPVSCSSTDLDCLTRWNDKKYLLIPLNKRCAWYHSNFYTYPVGLEVVRPSGRLTSYNLANLWTETERAIGLTWLRQLEVFQVFIVKSKSLLFMFRSSSHVCWNRMKDLTQMYHRRIPQSVQSSLCHLRPHNPLQHPALCGHPLKEGAQATGSNALLFKRMNLS